MTLTNDDFWAAIDARIAAAVKAESERVNARLHEQAKVHKVVLKLIDELGKTIDEKLARATDKVEAVGTEIRKLNADRPDSNGIVRREYFTPGTSEPH